MASTASVAEIAALVGDPARACMLTAMMDGRALTAAELAKAANVAPQTASGHLGRMSAAGLLSVQKQGRHRYHRLADAGVARMIEGIMAVAEGGRAMAAAGRIPSPGPRDQKMRAARTCYDHLAGRLGVGITEALVGRGMLELSDDGGALTADGASLLGSLGAELPVPRPGRPSARVLPPLPRLERAPPTRGRGGRRGAVFLLPAARLGAPGPRVAGSRRQPGRRAGH